MKAANEVLRVAVQELYRRDQGVAWLVKRKHVPVGVAAE
jgi:hypothetical protein